MPKTFRRAVLLEFGFAGQGSERTARNEPSVVLGWMDAGVCDSVDVDVRQGLPWEEGGVGLSVFSPDIHLDFRPVSRLVELQGLLATVCPSHSSPASKPAGAEEVGSAPKVLYHENRPRRLHASTRKGKEKRP